MNYKQNLHMHSTFCDGKDTPEQVIETALQKGFDSIGFSSHSYTSYSSEYTIKEGKEEIYKEHILSLKKKYDGKIDVFLGIEFDTAADNLPYGYDYIIGTVHSVNTFDGVKSFDRSADYVENLINTYFQGNGMAYAKAYFERLSHLARFENIDIIGHFDIITKHCETRDFFDMNSKDYLLWATDTMDALRGKIPFFEINTGAISRGYRTSPYPAITLIKELKARGFLPVITSDCHDRNFLDCEFDTCEKLLKDCGFNEKYVLTKDGWKGIKL